MRKLLIFTYQARLGSAPKRFRICIKRLGNTRKVPQRTPESPRPEGPGALEPWRPGAERWIQPRFPLSMARKKASNSFENSESRAPRRGSYDIVSWARRGSYHIVSWARRGSYDIVCGARRGSYYIVSWARRGSYDIVSWARRGSEYSLLFLSRNQLERLVLQTLQL